MPRAARWGQRPTAPNPGETIATASPARTRRGLVVVIPGLEAVAGDLLVAAARAALDVAAGMVETAAGHTTVVAGVGVDAQALRAEADPVVPPVDELDRALGARRGLQHLPSAQVADRHRG